MDFEIPKMPARTFTQQDVLDAYVEYQRCLIKAICLPQASSYKVKEAYQNYRHTLEHCGESININELVETTLDAFRAFHWHDAKIDDHDRRYARVAYTGMAWMMESLADDNLGPARASKQAQNLRDAIDGFNRRY